MPSAVLVGESLWLNCSYDLENEALYSVKWYFGKTEFYRYLPSEAPQVQIYESPGIFVDVSIAISGRLDCGSPQINGLLPGLQFLSSFALGPEAN